MLYLEVLLREESYSEANTLAKKLSQQFSEDAELLNRLAWMVATAVDSPKRDLSAALDAAERAVALTREQDADMLDTLARVCFCLGETERAVQIQQQAVARAPESERSPYEGALQEYLSDGQTASDTQR
jgi:tetratricopeptide (TPR) repeat protein